MNQSQPKARRRKRAVVRLNDWLERERERLFVGRADELTGFRGILEQIRRTRIIVISGPAGIGKSMLAEHLVALARRVNAPTASLDVQLLQAATPKALEAGIRERIAVFKANAPFNLLCIDNSERIAAMENWLRQQLPNLLPANSVLVLAGRWQPPTAWRADPALASILDHWPLTPLNANDVTTYVKRRELNAVQQASVAGFAHGHPLAMALAADHLLRTGEERLQPGKSGDLIQQLIDWLLSNIQNTEYHQCLDAAATLHFVNEPVLQVMMPQADAGRLYQWLAAQPYMEHRRQGLLMHELVRTVIIEDLRRRNLPRHHRLIRRAADFYMADLGRQAADALHAALTEVTYTLRWEPYFRRFYDLGSQTHYLDEARADEREVLADIVERQEGSDAREWFLYWYEKRPDVLEVVRDEMTRPTGILLAVILDQNDMYTTQSDPAAHRFLRYLKHHAPLKNGEKALLVRFGMAADTYQKTEPAFTQVVMKVNSLTFLPGLVYFTVVCDRDKDWQSSADYANFKALPGGDFQTQRRRHEIRGTDLKAEPPLIWLRNTLERTLGAHGDEQAKPSNAPLTRHEFADAVLQAMRDFTSDETLATNPLLNSHLLKEYANADEPVVNDLRRLIRQTVQLLNHTDPHKHWPEILDYSYFRGDRKQISAAAALSISESTYRRRLRQAEQRLIDRLWARETGLAGH